MKDLILQTALQQFLKNGIREVSNNKLVELLGISTKTLYKHFTNKEELLEEALLLFYTQQFQALEEIVADQKAIPVLLDIWYASFEREHQITNAFFRDLHHYYPEVETKIEKVIGKKFTKQNLSIIQKGIDEGVFQANILPGIVMEGIYVLYNAATRTDKFNKYDASPLELLLNTIVVHIRGFCTVKGIHEMEEHIATFQPIGKARKQIGNNSKDQYSYINS